MAVRCADALGQDGGGVGGWDRVPYLLKQDGGGVGEGRMAEWPSDMQMRSREMGRCWGIVCAIFLLLEVEVGQVSTRIMSVQVPNPLA